MISSLFRSEPTAMRFVVDHIEALIELGRREEALELLDWYEGHARRLERASALAAPTRCRGLLAAAAGTVDPYLALAMGVRPEGDVRVAMEFADDDQARANADSRTVLATGPAVGQGGDFADRFALRSASADGTVVVLDLDPVAGAYVLSDLSTGPVLFATC